MSHTTTILTPPGEANALPGPDVVTLPAGMFALAIAGAGDECIFFVIHVIVVLSN